MSKTDQGPVILNVLKNTVGGKTDFRFPTIAQDTRAGKCSLCGNYSQYTHFHMSWHLKDEPHTDSISTGHYLNRPNKYFLQC